MINFRTITALPSVAFGRRRLRLNQVYYRQEIGRPLRSRLSLPTLQNQTKRRRAGDSAMKKLLPGAVGLVALGLPPLAFAADLSVPAYSKAPGMIPAYYDWSGFYLGLNGGGGSSRKCWGLGNSPASGGCRPPS